MRVTTCLDLTIFEVLTAVLDEDAGLLESDAMPSGLRKVEDKRKRHGVTSQ